MSNFRIIDPFSRLRAFEFAIHGCLRTLGLYLLARLLYCRAMKTSIFLRPVAVSVLLCTLTVSAADKYWVSGTGNWNTTDTSWSTTSGGSPTAAWTDGDNAIIEGPGGTITLSEEISISHLLLATNDYTIIGNTLNFGAGGTITNKGMMVTISCGVVGAPNVYASHPNGWGGPYGVNGFFLSPTAGNMEIGTIYRPIDNYMVISGTSTGNVIAAMPKGNANNKMRWNGPGTWSVAGDCYAGEFYVNGGKLITGGRTYTDYRYITPIDGATLIVNGTLEDLTFTGGTVGGTGTIRVAVNVPVTGTLAPGYPTGVLSVTNSACSIAGALEINVDGAAHGLLAVDGALTISNATLKVVSAATPPDDLIIATYTALNGQFAVTNMPGGWEVNYSYQGGRAIALIPPALGTVLIIR